MMYRCRPSELDDEDWERVSKHTVIAKIENAAERRTHA